MKCGKCHEDTNGDTFLLNIKRVKNTEVTFAKPICLCYECYEELRTSLEDREGEKND